MEREEYSSDEEEELERPGLFRLVMSSYAGGTDNVEPNSSVLPLSARREMSNIFCYILDYEFITRLIERIAQSGPRTATNATTTTTDNNRSERDERISRVLRRRRYTYLDSQTESQDELDNPKEEESYPDFRTYPLMINWNDIHSIENDSCTYIYIHTYAL